MIFASTHSWNGLELPAWPRIMKPQCCNGPTHMPASDRSSPSMKPTGRVVVLSLPSVGTKPNARVNSSRICRRRSEASATALACSYWPFVRCHALAQSSAPS